MGAIFLCFSPEIHIKNETKIFEKRRKTS